MKLNQALVTHEKSSHEWKDEKSALHKKIRQLEEKVKALKEKDDYLISLSQKYNTLAKSMDILNEQLDYFKKTANDKEAEAEKLRSKVEEQK